MNSAVCGSCLFVTLFMSNLSFLFSLCVSNLVLNILGIVNTYVVNTPNYFRIFLTLLNLSLNSGIMVSFKGWYH